MKYIKRFENISEDVPKVGDFVLIKMGDTTMNYDKDIVLRYNKIKDFVTHTIGKIVSIRLKISDDFGNESIGNVTVKYDNIPEDFQSWFSSDNKRVSSDNKRVFSLDQIVEFGKTKDELEEKMMIKKYNI